MSCMIRGLNYLSEILIISALFNSLIARRNSTVPANLAHCGCREFQNIWQNYEISKIVVITCRVLLNFVEKHEYSMF